MAKSGLAIIRSAFQSPADEYSGAGIRPVVIDILGPDLTTSLLGDYRMVLHVNPTSMSFSYSKIIERGQTKGGWVEQHFGEGTDKIEFQMATGGFMRLYTGLSNITGGGLDVGGNRRQTIAYDKYLDLLALFHNKASIYDANGQIVFQGIFKVSFDGAIWFGWFDNFTVSEAAEKPYQFSLTTSFTVAREVLGLRTTLVMGTPTQSLAQRAEELTAQRSSEAIGTYGGNVMQEQLEGDVAAQESTRPPVTRLDPDRGAWSLPE